MKKPKSNQVKETPQQKLNETSPIIEIKKKLIFNRKTFKKEKMLSTKANTTMTESSKEDKVEKKDISIKKRNKNGSNNANKSNLSFSMKEKKLNKTIELEVTSNKKKKIKKHRNSTKNKSVIGHQHFDKLHGGSSSKLNLKKNKSISKSFLLSYTKTESSNNIMLGSEDNFVKTLLSKYMDGSDNIINEDSEAFNNIKSNIDNEDLSLFGDENENTETNTVRETLDINNNINKKDSSNNDNNSNNNTLNKMNSYNNKGNNLKLNSSKNNRKEFKLSLKITKSENNKLKTNFSKSFINSPRTKKERLSTGFNHNTNNNNKNSSVQKKTNSSIVNKIKSFRKNSKLDNSIRSNSNEKERLKRKMQYATKLIDGMNKLKQYNKNKTEIYSNKNEVLPVIASNLNLDIIFENNKLKSNVVHHYLENTVSAKNKMVQKKNSNPDQTKNSINSFHKNEENNNSNNNSTKPINTEKIEFDKTPKIKKDKRLRFSVNFNKSNSHNLSNQTKNYNGRKFSQHVKCDLTLENSVSNKTIINSKIFQKKLDDYLITRELGKGSYAVVKLAMDKKTKNKYAIKIYSKQCLIDPQLRNTVKNEINILKQIDNENIMKLYEVIDTQSNLYLVLEYINGINLLEIIKNEKLHYINETRAKKIFMGVVLGIGYCHKINIYHRDIKLENILVLKDDTVKIIDFGFGIICKDDSYQKLFCGTKSYMPPEIIKKEKYIASYSDIWSLGVLFYAMLFGVFPFKGKDEDELFEKIKEAKITFPEYNPISEKTKELFEKIFVIIPSERISLDDMINYLKEEE